MKFGYESEVFADRRLPEQVFARGYKEFRFAEFDVVMSPEFWGELQALLSASNSRALTLNVLDPSPDYFMREFGKSGSFRLDVSASPSQYGCALEQGPEGSPADAPLYNSTVVAWVPDSKRWCIWGQRETDLCVLGMKENFRTGGAWCSINEIGDISHWAARSDLLAELRRNYS